MLPGKAHTLSGLLIRMRIGRIRMIFCLIPCLPVCPDHFENFISLLWNMVHI